MLPHADDIEHSGNLKVHALVQLKMQRRILGHCRDYCTTAARLQPQYGGKRLLYVLCVLADTDKETE